MKKISERLFSNKIFTVLFLLAVTLPASLPLLRSGFYEPHDLHHLADIFEMYRTLSSGQIPPRFSPDFLYNLGYPLFNFYYLLPFLLGALFFALGVALTTSFKLVFFVSILLSVIGMYLFLREFVGKWAAIAGAALFLYTPYRAVEIYVRGAVGEALALSILPLVLWIIFKIAREKNLKHITLGAIIGSLFLISHNYLWFLSLPAIFLLSFLLINKTRGINIKTPQGCTRRLLMTIFLSFGLSSFWLIPAVLERKHIDRLTPFLLEDHFPFIKQLIFPSWGYGSSVWGPGDEISFQIGVVNIAVMILGVGLLLWKRSVVSRNISKLALWATLGFFGSVFMMNIRSLFLWKLIPFYNFIQFPWRLLFLTTLFSSVMAAVFIEIMTKSFSKTLKVLSPILVVVISILLTLGYFKPNNIVNKSDNYYLERMFATRRIDGYAREVDEKYKNWSEDYLLLPNWSEVKPDDIYNAPVEIISGYGEIIDTDQLSDDHFLINIDADTEFDLAFNKLYFPGWVAKVDGVEKKIEPNKPAGSIKLVDLPRGIRTVEFRWQETGLRKISDLMSIISLLIVIFIYIRGDESKFVKKIFN